MFKGNVALKAPLGSGRFAVALTSPAWQMYSQRARGKFYGRDTHFASSASHDVTRRLMTRGVGSKDVSDMRCNRNSVEARLTKKTET